MNTLFGNCTLLCGNTGVGKSTEGEKILLATPNPEENNIILDWHGDFARKGIPGKKFSMMQVKEFIDYCALPTTRGKTIFMEEMENYFARSKYNPFGIDRVKINWILSGKGEHHQNNHVVCIYHHLPQIPDEIKDYYDFFMLWEQGGTYNAIKSLFDNTQIFDAYLWHEAHYNLDSEKIELTLKNGTKKLVKPPIIFKKGVPITKPQLA